ncbi:MAG: hypothetical protein CBE26_03490 [Kiritimatiellaceae bacterium TMED266]|nr:MAG: hypothetical protein CBE26_03490 [Kiritimatiellaceae bacterium TMED266]
MKILPVLGVFLLSGVLSVEAFTEKELKMLQRDTKIEGVRSNSIKNKNRERSEILEINTSRDEDQQTGFQIYTLVEVTDKEKESYLIEYRANQAELDSEFTGEEYYELIIPNGEVGRLKVTAYAIQYGITDDEGSFTMLAEEFDDVESVDELKERTSTRFPEKVTMKHYHIFDSGGHEESIRSTLRNINL